MHPDNLRRVARAEKVMAGYADWSPPGVEELADLLADLRHWAAANGIDYARANGLAVLHYGVESAANG